MFAGGLPGLKKTPVKHEEPATEEPKQSPKAPEEPKLATPPALKIPEQKPAQEAPKARKFLIL